MNKQVLNFITSPARSGHDDEGVFRYIITIPKKENKIISKYHSKQIRVIIEEI